MFSLVFLIMRIRRRINDRVALMRKCFQFHFLIIENKKGLINVRCFQGHFLVNNNEKSLNNERFLMIKLF